MFENIKRLFTRKPLRDRKVNIKLEVDGETDILLEVLRKEANCESKVELLRHAITLMAFAIIKKQEGNEVRINNVLIKFNDPSKSQGFEVHSKGVKNDKKESK